MKSNFLTASLLASALIAGLAAAPAMAQGTYTPGIDQSQQVIFRKAGDPTAATPFVARAIGIQNPDEIRIVVPGSYKIFGFIERIVEAPVVLVTAVGVSIEPVRHAIAFYDFHNGIV